MDHSSLQKLFDSLGIPPEKRNYERIELRGDVAVVYIETEIGEVSFSYPIAFEGKRIQVGERNWDPEVLRTLLRQPGWLSREYRLKGSLRKVLSSFDIDPSYLSFVRRFAHNELNWRTAEGSILKLWQFLFEYFRHSEFNLRPSVRDLATSLRLTRKTGYNYIERALQGNFFGGLDSHRLDFIQSYALHDPPYIFFPDSKLDPSDFALARASGFPNLPPGLVHDLLPHLSLSLDRVTFRGGVASFQLTHHGKLDFDLRLNSFKPAADALNSPLSINPLAPRSSSPAGSGEKLTNSGRAEHLLGRPLLIHVSTPEGPFSLVGFVSLVRYASSADLYTPSQ